MKDKNLIKKVIWTLVAYVAASVMASFISKTIMGKTFISQTYFLEAFFPLVTVIWMKHTNIETKVIRILIAVALCLLVSLATPFVVGVVAQNNIGLAAEIAGFQVGLVFIVYAWLWGTLILMSKRESAATKR